MATSGRRGISLQWQMLMGFLVGLVLGLIANATVSDAAWVEWISTYVTGPVGQIFLRLIFMMVMPLLVSALIVGIAEMGDIGSLKRVGLKTLAFTVVVSGVAVVLALAVTNYFQPGMGVHRPNRCSTVPARGPAPSSQVRRTSRWVSTQSWPSSPAIS